MLASVLLGATAYRKYRVGELSCKTAGLWTVGLGLVAGADLLVSKWLFEKFSLQK